MLVGDIEAAEACSCMMILQLQTAVPPPRPDPGLTCCQVLMNGRLSDMAATPGMQLTF
jgi:hypothetical protein